MDTILFVESMGRITMVNNESTEYIYVFIYMYSIEIDETGGGGG